MNPTEKIGLTVANWFQWLWNKLFAKPVDEAVERIEHVMTDVQAVFSRLQNFADNAQNKATDLVLEGEAALNIHRATVARLETAHAEKQNVISYKLDDVTTQLQKASVVKDKIADILNEHG